MRTTWEKVVQHNGIALGQDISIELQMRKLMVIKYPNQSQEILERQIRKVQMSNTTHTRMRESRKKV